MFDIELTLTRLDEMEIYNSPHMCGKIAQMHVLKYMSQNILQCEREKL